MSRTKKTAVAPTEKSNIAEQLKPLALEVGMLVLDERNARAHDERSIEAIAASLERYGQRKPIVVQRTADKKLVVRAGNGTVVAAKRKGWTHVAAVVVEESDKDASGFAIADNRTAELSEWNYSTIASLLEEFELDPAEYALGFTADELKSIVSVTPWDENEEDGNGRSVDEDSGASNVSVTFKVRVHDLANRTEIQRAVEKLLVDEYPGLAEVKS